MKKAITTLLLLCIFFAQITAQNAEKTDIKVVTKDGSIITGSIVEESKEEITILSETLGQITLQRSNISSIQLGEVDSKKTNFYDVDYYNSTRNLISPTGFLLKKGQSYYENVGVFFNSYAVGITDHFNIAVGGDIASLLFAKQFPILYVSPKVGVPFSNGGAWSIGTTIFTSPSDNFSGFGFLNTSITLGDRNNHFSLGTGVGFNFSGDFSEQIVPLMLGGTFRISNKISFVTDNFVIFYDDFSNSTAVLSLGVRIHFKNGAAINAALWRPTEEISIIALPFVSATIPLGRGR